MSWFNNTQHMDVRGSTFNDVGHDQIYGDQVHIGQLIHINNPDPLALLYPVPDAAYDSRGCASGCLQGTREEILRKIMAWVDGGNEQPLGWLYGAAGSGKSAISRTIAECCAASNRLGASFFFLRGAGRRTKINHFVSTLAHNLAFSVPATRPCIERGLQRDPHIIHGSLERQFHELITRPILSLEGRILPMVMIVDALDECDDKTAVADFIGVVIRAFRDHPLPLRFLFTSRVEEHIRKMLASPAVRGTVYHLALQDFDADADIRTFFRSRFTTIYEENHRLMRQVSLPWPSQSDLNTLVKKSSGSFIFAFTFVNFVNDGSDLPHRKLQAGLRGHAGLDPLYMQVIETAPRSSHFERVLVTIILVRSPLSIVDIGFLLQIEVGDVIHALQGVQSILIVPEDDEQPVRPFHTSLRDFLTTEARSKEHFINQYPGHLSIAADCLTLMTLRASDEFFHGGILKFTALGWYHHLSCAVDQGGGDILLDSYHGDFMMNKLIDFVSGAFDSWVDCIIAHLEFDEAIKTLESVLSKLTKYDHYSQKMSQIIKQIIAFVEVCCPISIQMVTQ